VILHTGEKKDLGVISPGQLNLYGWFSVGTLLLVALLVLRIFLKICEPLL
jgi:hypothetical protein